MADDALMTRLENMCRTALNWASTWGAEFALEHVRVAVEGESKSVTWPRGRRFNRRAYLGSQVVMLRDRVQDLEKQARKTPPKTLLRERARVEEARVALERCRIELALVDAEWVELQAWEEREWKTQHG